MGDPTTHGGSRRTGSACAFEARRFIKSPKIWGTIDGFYVYVGTTGRGGRLGSLHTRIVVRHAEPAPTAIGLASETFWSSLGGSEDAVRTGDPRFDDAVSLRGAEGTLRAALDQQTRQLVLELIRCDRGYVQNDQVVSETPGEERDIDVLERRVRRMVKIAERISVSEEQVPDRIAQNVIADDETKMRLSNLSYLAANLRRTPACDRAARAALRDDCVKIRILAARLVGADGIEVLEEVLAGRDHPKLLRIEALEILSGQLSKDLLAERIKPYLRPGGRSLALAALRIAERENLRAASAHLPAMTTAPSVSIAVAATRALGVVGNASHTPHLIELLRHGRDPVKIAACSSLGRIGTTDAVWPLLEQTQGIFRDPDLKRAARYAVDQIQARAEGAEGGRLSVMPSSSPAGAVSVAEASRKGSLADPPDDPPRKPPLTTGSSSVSARGPKTPKDDGREGS